MLPMPKMCPRLVVAKRAGQPMPPKKVELGRAVPADGKRIVALPRAIATTLQTIMTMAQAGVQPPVAGAVVAKKIKFIPTNCLNFTKGNL